MICNSDYELSMSNPPPCHAHLHPHISIRRIVANIWFKQIQWPFVSAHEIVDMADKTRLDKTAGISPSSMLLMIVVLTGQS